MRHGILITCATFLDFLIGCFGSFIELEGMELIESVSQAKGKVRVGFLQLAYLKMP